MCSLMRVHFIKVTFVLDLNLWPVNVKICKCFFIACFICIINVLIEQFIHKKKEFDLCFHYIARKLVSIALKDCCKIFWVVAHWPMWKGPTLRMFGL